MERRLTPPADGARPSRPMTRFSALELVAAEQLIQLSESSCSSLTPGGGGVAPAAASASSSSPRSINAPPGAAPAQPHEHGLVVAVAGDDEEDAQEVGGRPRRNRRNRPIAEIYAATAPIGVRRRKDKAPAGPSN